MKKILCIHLVFFAAIQLNGQVNLVPNPSFEVYDTCPSTPDKIKFAVPWFQPNNPQGQYSSSTDYYNACALSMVSVPGNLFGYQYARTGSAYIGITLFEDPTDNAPREYAEVELDMALFAGRKYCVSLYASLPGDPYGACMATSAFGLYFSNDTCQYISNWAILPVQPQLINDPSNFVSDTAGWTLLNWEYTAQGGEKFITFGNFWDGSYNTPNSYPVCNSGAASHFFIDDVSVLLLPILNAGADRVIPEGDTTTIAGSISENWPGMQFEWFPHSGLADPYSLNTIASPTVTTTYTLTVNCASCNVPCLSDLADSLTVIVEPASPPAEFSFELSNLLFTDQVFYISNLPAKTQVAIYDMRGRKIFESNDYANDFQLANLSAANYVYEVILNDGSKYKGKFAVVER